eukprot:comp19993_c0_seq1/m.24459 comp19993_c0_seq1/g.24459  ORF comp19993_c0_seq1/g.24459 comp19993_c0_seq1/m.24459 type:complete len:119 (-) comp19993_c0_seq1:233-589(-)
MSETDADLDSQRRYFADRATLLHNMLVDLIDACEREKSVSWAIKLRMQDLELSRLELEAKKKRRQEAHMATQVQGTTDTFHQELDNSEDVPRDIPDIPPTGEERNRVRVFEESLNSDR